MSETVSLKEFLQEQVKALSKEVDGHKASNTAWAESLESRIDRINSRLTTIESKAMGKNESWAFFVAAGGMVLAAISTFAFFMK